MPDAPVAPAPAAPATPSAPAPVSSTSAAPAPPTSTPAAPATPPSAATPAGAPPTPAPPAKYDPQSATVPPNASDYPQTSDGNDAFMADNGAWLLTHPEEAAKLRGETREKPGEITAADLPEGVTAPEPAAVEPEKPVEAPKPPEAPVAAATPAVIEEWTGKSQKLKEAFAENPELQSAIMGMARDMEAAKPVLDIVSTREEAEFAVDHANRLVNLQAAWMLGAEDPEMTESAWNQTVEMFKERDANGAEVKGADGQPKLGNDFKPFVAKAATTALKEFQTGAGARVTALQERLKGNYATEEARAADTEALESATYDKAAFDYVLEKLSGTTESALPALPPNATPAQIAYQKDLEAREKAQAAREGKQTTESRKAARATLNKEVQAHYETGLNRFIDSRVAAMKERGEYIPDFVLTDKWINPQTGKTSGLSAFGVKIYQQLNQKINNNPTHRTKLTGLEILGPAGKEARFAELDRLQTLYLPSLIDAEIERIQNDIRKGEKPKPPGTVNPQSNNAGVPRLEPQSQGTVVPQAMNDSQMRDWAIKEAQKDPGFVGMTQRDREEMILQLQMRKKYTGQ